ncbi:hypothetical protein PILCRDRAFT_826887 [Piloderma croceum F 1598]|uniref:Uncharacterized protein n=1 Tax=Piloderma croceum (strain F 1598) TaxID=765440 RepID=A0A0C3BEV1_PILCF|nr:hypothetical protein PILCRDRAFT_826887 [Piloderma croceum F 1598]
MHFLSLCSLVILATATHLVGAYNPIGQSCDTPGGEGCSQDAAVNGGNAFIYECGPADTFVYLAGCGCPTCCSATASGAFCT